MDGNIDKVREAIEGLLRAANRNVGGMAPGVIASWCYKALATLSAIDPEAIRREFWDELRAEAETQYDRRLELLGPIETLDDAAFRKTLGDGWSAWLLAKRITENRRSAILSDEPAQDDGKPDVVMTMIENGDMSISWECSACKKLIDDKEDIETVEKCPHCGAPISDFLYIEEDEE